MSLFNSLGNQNNGPMNPMQAVQQLKNNPTEFISNMGFNIPDGVDTSNPNSIINGLLQSGQIKNGRFQQIMNMMNRKV